VSKESRRTAKAAAASRAAGTSTSGTERTTSTGPSGSPRAGRRERTRHYEQKPFLERYRGLLIGAVVVAVAVAAGTFLFAGATQAAYSCSLEWEASPTPSPAPGATNRLGYLQDNMGNSHSVSRPQKYLYCPPATGTHLNVVGQAPITPRVYAPDDTVGPMNWLHNLEHGGLVILYRGDGAGATAAGQAAFQAFFDAFPAGPICETPPHQVSPVIARFDQMKTPFAALVWGRILPMETWDPALALEYYATESVRIDANGEYVAPPEPAAAGCPPVTPSVAPSESVAPSDSVAPSASAAPSTSPAASGSALPSGSPEPSPASS
jgi:hypothetical protein